MKTFTTAILSLVAISSALPTSSMEARAEGAVDVQVCTGENYTGECTTISAAFNECQVLPGPYLNNVGSLKPAAGAFCRITYTAATCTLHGDAFIDPTPGAPDLHHFDDPATGANIDAGSSLSSFLCQECTGCS
ncbi:hypothetical protein K505DRAFT_248723 [Melanomma pulvis-pyrius CBS 109.77]|uniref:Uncharacterized protein n=1 Tax=Melanomma pulvis-pyrius CBS 109.77 TaxID=1314802 RepID=A0A6A6X6I5_9PLEO|nr:hypothetical protein K505DRAFT_248723 [Melanomma pulvis-pyrius CBS 109.77]